MKKLNIEQSIRRSISLETPDLFDKIVSVPVRKLESEDYIIKSRPKASSSRLRTIYATCSCFALLFAVCVGFFNQFQVIDTIIAIDVNPSVQIATNKSDKVLSVTALNTDAEVLLEDKDYKNKNYNVVVKDVVDTMANQGYIDESKNSVLVSVSNSNEEKASNVQTSVVTDIKDALTEKKITAVVYNQSISDSTDLEELAKEYHISFGKMKFINKIIEQDPSLSVEQLAKLSLQDISTLVNSKEIDMKDVVACDNTTKEVLASNKKTPTTTPTAVDPVAIPKTESPTTTDHNSQGDTIPGTDSSGSTNTEPLSPSSIAPTPDSGVVVAKPACNLCPTSCHCDNCTKGCKTGCTSCDKNCPNYKPSSGTNAPPESTTGSNNDDDEEIIGPGNNVDTSGTGNSTSTEDTTPDNEEGTTVNSLDDSTEKETIDDVIDTEETTTSLE